ncbi:MAG: hypothetical protein L6R42_010101, partial [Xanthoria sp. 1 TBL-2021]
YPIAPGGNFTYKFSVGNEYGFYWYHSHVRAYYNDAIRGPLMIRPSPLRRRPFEPLAANNDELAELLQTERDATSILLYDWTHDLSDTVYARYFNTGAFPHCVDSLLANGLGRTKCLPDYILRAGPALGLDPTSVRVSDSSQISTGTSLMNMSKMNKRVVTGDSSMSDHMAMQEMSTNEMPVMPSMTPMSSMTSMSEMDSMSETDSMSSMPSMSEMDSLSETDSMSSMPSMSGSDSMSSMPSMPNMDSSMNMQAMGPLSPRGCTPPMMFKPGFNISSLPSETCVNTTSPLLTIHANRTQGWLALNLVNSGAVSKLGVSLDAHSMYVYAADGLFVTLQEVKVS